MVIPAAEVRSGNGRYLQAAAGMLIGGAEPLYGAPRVAPNRSSWLKPRRGGVARSRLEALPCDTEAG